MNYYLYTNGQQSGPFADDQLRQMLTSGIVHSTDLCWRDGLSEWIPILQVMGPILPPIPSAVQSTQFAGFWLRVVAFVVDQIILLVPAFAIGFVIGVAMASSGSSKDDIEAFCRLVGIVLAWLYYACMESSPLQATLGKLALGLRVTDESGSRIGFGRATGRYFGKFISAILLGIGFIVAGFSPRKQALHDSMAGCLVIRK